MQAVNYGRDEGSRWEGRSRWKGGTVPKSLTPKARGRPMGILGREAKDHFRSIGCDELEWRGSGSRKKTISHTQKNYDSDNGYE